MTNLYELESLLKRFVAEGMPEDEANQIGAATTAKMLGMAEEESAQVVVDWINTKSSDELGEIVFNLINFSSSVLSLLHQTGDIIDQNGLT